MIMFTANTAPATAASRRSRQAPRAEPALFGHHASAPSTGSAYAQRHSAAAAGATEAFATRMAVNAIVSAPSTPASAGRSLTAGSTRCRRAGTRAARRRGRSRRWRRTGTRSRCRSPSAISTSAPVTAPPSPWRRTAGSVATPTISATSPTGRSVPVAAGPAGVSATTITLWPVRSRWRMCSENPAASVTASRSARPSGSGRRARRAEADLGDGQRGVDRVLVRVQAAQRHRSRRLRRAPQRPVEHEQRHLEHVQAGRPDRADQRRRRLVHPLERLGLAELAQPGASGFDRFDRERVTVPAQPRPRVVRPRRLRDEQRERAVLLDARRPPRRRVEEVIDGCEVRQTNPRRSSADPAPCRASPRRRRARARPRAASGPTSTRP